MVKRFVEDVQLRPQPTASGAAQAQSDLASRLEAFSTQTRAISQQLGALQGAREAREQPIERDEQGRTVAPETRDLSFVDLLLTGGERTGAFNETLRDGYLASLENDIRRDVADVAQRNPDDLTKFNSQIDGYAKGVLDGVDPAVRDPVQRFLDNQLTSTRISIQGNTLQRAEREADSQVAAAIESAGIQAAREARDGKPVASGQALQDAFAHIDGQVERGRLSPQRAQQQKRELEREATEQGFMFQLDATMDTQGSQAAFKQLDDLSKEVPEGWTPDEWNTFVASAQADLNQKITRQARQQAAITIDESRQISDLKIQASTGTGDAGAIVKKTEELFDAGKINESERTSIFTNLIRGQQRGRQEAFDMSNVAKRLNGNDRIVLDDKSVNRYYEQNVQPNLQDMPLEKQQQNIAFFVNRTKRVPNALKAQINSFLQSDNPDLISEASQLIDLIDNTPGLVEREFSASERAFAQNVVELSANMTPNEATRLARQLTDPSDQSRIKVRQGIIKDEKLPEEYRSIVDSHFRPLFRTQVDDISGDQLSKEYGDLFEAHYLAGMSESAAKEKALQIIGRNWGKSDVTGRVMKYPPDQYYAVNGDVSYIKEQLVKDVNDNFMFEGDPITSDQVFLQSTEETARTASGGQPEYRVVINRDGTLMPIYGKENLWQPDTQAEMARIEGENKARLEKQRQEVISNTEQIRSLNILRRDR